MSDKQAVDVFADAGGQLALPVEGFRRIFRPSVCRLDPMEGSPLVWQYTDTQQNRGGVVLNVPGLLNGGAMSIESRGWFYETELDGRHVALFMPGMPRRIHLGETNFKVLDAEGSRVPLFPAEWPRGAVQRVVRVRMSPIVVLDAAYLLAQVPVLPAPAKAAAPPPAPEPAPEPESPGSPVP